MSQRPYVLDSSAVLAVIKNEPGGDQVLPKLADAVISAPNAAEVSDKLVRTDRTPDDVLAALDELGLTIVAADADLAMAAGGMFRVTRSAGLSLGDRFCLALAKRLDLPALTGDRRWAEVADAIGVEVELFR